MWRRDIVSERKKPTKPWIVEFVTRVCVWHARCEESVVEHVEQEIHKAFAVHINMWRMELRRARGGWGGERGGELNCDVVLIISPFQRDCKWALGVNG